uniref:Ribosomal protein S11 n=1 Tax=Eucampia zodiacus TaxID=444606 RepID=A0A7T0CRA3_9STRA|nr:ribosomal protein S11 [Eucampia zodiacus]QPJ79926.1 ribosomal protein S11 [Eucampia zodiacus]
MLIIIVNMLLSKILKTKKHEKVLLKKLYFFIKILEKSQNNNKIILNLMKKYNMLKLYFNTPKLLSYIIVINMSLTNTIVSLIDTKGKLLISLSAGQLHYKGKQKKKQPTVLISLLKELLIKSRFIGNKPIAIHFKNTKAYHESIVISMLSEKFFIQFIKSYNLLPHNGCRPKKLKRLKNKS